MTKTTIEKELLAELIGWIEGVSRTHNSRYDRKLKHYAWNDEIFKAADPHTYRLVVRARAALGASEQLRSTEDGQ